MHVIFYQARSLLVLMIALVTLWCAAGLALAWNHRFGRLRHHLSFEASIKRVTPIIIYGPRYLTSNLSVTITLHPRPSRTFWNIGLETLSGSYSSFVILNACSTNPHIRILDENLKEILDLTANSLPKCLLEVRPHTWTLQVNNLTGMFI